MTITKTLCLFALALLPALSGVPAAAQDNPLLTTPNTPFQTPPFDNIRNEHFVPAIKEAIRQAEAEVDAIVNNPQPATFENTVAAFDMSGQLLDWTTSIFYSLTGTVSSPQLQDIANEISPLMSAYYDNVWLNQKLFERIKTVYDQRDGLQLTTEEAHLLDYFYLRFVRRGALLTEEQKARLRDINREHSLLDLKFGDNVLAETNNSYIVVENESDLAGLPDAIIAMGKEAAESMNMPGNWVYTTQRASFTPFMQHSDMRDLRKELLTKYSMRGDRNNEYDNKEILKQMFTLREERCRILGYPSPADFYMEPRMAATREAVASFLQLLWQPALNRAKTELAQMQTIMDTELKGAKLEPWDWWYYAEKLRKAKYLLDDAELRPYFVLENVQDGMFILADTLFGLKFVERNDIPIYHPSVRVFEVWQAADSLLGILYMDYFVRDSKHGGAWSGGFRGAFMQDGQRVLPLGTIVCNFPRPTADMPSLLSFDEVETIFHEFGHALNGLLYSGNYRSGYAPLDITELPSQIMENWALEPELLNIYARHYQTGEIIPASLVERIKNSYLFNKGFEATEYLAACFLDMAWHGLENAENVDVNAFEDSVIAAIGLIPEMLPRYRSTYFTHIHGGYSAGYYAYYWSGVLDADAFAAFKETSLFDRQTAAAFRENILEKLGTDDAMKLYKRFRGREPVIDPFLERNGLQ
ncbi:MAG: M3 family metallopeptidase [Candidatus Zixiibacteriota bacterium]